VNQRRSDQQALLVHGLARVAQHRRPTAAERLAKHREVLISFGGHQAGELDVIEILVRPLG
jgi:hypothetical protein